jgi:hypothetical protein
VGTACCAPTKQGYVIDMPFAEGSLLIAPMASTCQMPAPSLAGTVGAQHAVPIFVVLGPPGHS